MSELQSFKRFPSVQCWIKHILEGRFSNEEKVLFTIFGKIKRVRIMTTIIDKREQLEGEGNRIEFDLDDGTGLIRATLWGVEPENYSKYVKGDLVDVVGLIRNWNEFKSISPEIINVITEPNLILLRDAEIIKRIKSGDLHEIPDVKVGESTIDDFPNEVNIDVMDLFEDDKVSSMDDEKEKLYYKIKERAKNGVGVSFNDLKKIMQISDEKLRSQIRDLEVESRIYQSEENIFQTYD